MIPPPPPNLPELRCYPPRRNKTKPVSSSDQRPGTPGVFIQGFHNGNTFVKVDPPVWAPSKQKWIEERRKRFAKPQHSFDLKQFEQEMYPRPKIQSEISEHLDLDERNPKKTEDLPLETETPMVKAEKRESFAEFLARMNTRPDGTIASSRDRIGSGVQQAQAPPTIPKPTEDKVAPKDTSKLAEAEADDANISLNEPVFDESFSLVDSEMPTEKQSKASISENKLEKSFPSTGSTSFLKWENPLEGMRARNSDESQTMKRFNPQLGRPGSSPWCPLREPNHMVLPPLGKTLTPESGSIIREHPFRPLANEIEKSETRRNPVPRQSIMAAFPPRPRPLLHKQITGMVLPNKVTLTAKSRSIIQDYPPRPYLDDKFAATKEKLDTHKDPDSRLKIIPAIAPGDPVNKQGENIRQSKIDVGLSTLTKSMLPRNVKPDADSGPQ